MIAMMAFTSELSTPKQHVDMLRLSRLEVSEILAAMSGHWAIGRHAMILTVLTNDICGMCGDDDGEAP